MILKTAQILILFVVLLSCKMNNETVNPAEPIRYLALGDSYTIGESVPSADNFPAQLFQALRDKNTPVSSYKIIARTGWTTTNLKAAIETSGLKDTFNLVSLLIGVNNQYQGKSIIEYKSEFIELANRAIQFAGGKKERVFIVSIPDYGYTPFGKNNQASISAQITAFNAVNKQVSDSLGLKYYNITPISQRGLAEPDLVAGDGLHPSAKMYKEWVELIMNDKL
jgi:lysophospholipase L1-like esterase